MPRIIFSVAASLFLPGVRAGLAGVHDCNLYGPTSERIKDVKLKIASISGYDSYSYFVNGSFAATNSLGSRTFDAQLLNLLTGLLGFSYDAVDLVSKGANESWEEWTPRILTEYDMVLTYWSKTPSRLDKFCIPEHTSNNRIIVVDGTEQQTRMSFVDHTAAIWESIHSPFDWSVWVSIFVLVFANAFALYMLEWDHEDFDGATKLRGYGLALYQSVALIPGSSDHRPRTAAGKTLFVVWGLVVVVLLAWYTGDLAGSQAAQSFQTSIRTIEELRISGKRVCYPKTRTDGAAVNADPLEVEIKAALASRDLAAQEVFVARGTGTPGQIRLMEAAMRQEGGCRAMVVPENGYDEYLENRSAYVYNGAGYAVSLNSSSCIQPALQWAYSQLSFYNNTNFLDQLQQGLRDHICPEISTRSDTRVTFTQVGFLIYTYIAMWLISFIPMLVKFNPSGWLAHIMPRSIKPEYNNDESHANFFAEYSTGTSPLAKAKKRRHKVVLGNYLYRLSRSRQSVRLKRAVLQRPSPEAVSETSENAMRHALGIDGGSIYEVVSASADGDVLSRAVTTNCPSRRSSALTAQTDETVSRSASAHGRLHRSTSGETSASAEIIKRSVDRQRLATVPSPRQQGLVLKVPSHKVEVLDAGVQLEDSVVLDASAISRKPPPPSPDRSSSSVASETTEYALREALGISARPEGSRPMPPEASEAGAHVAPAMRRETLPADGMPVACRRGRESAPSADASRVESERSNSRGGAAAPASPDLATLLKNPEVFAAAVARALTELGAVGEASLAAPSAAAPSVATAVRTSVLPAVQEKKGGRAWRKTPRTPEVAPPPPAAEPAKRGFGFASRRKPANRDLSNSEPTDASASDKQAVPRRWACSEASR